ncbi:MAG: SIMPL domain-containing protein, partial [Candidatus Krumholzibacteria bacterium]|nr:SIMPL domain-containing protein [Candidatus Krumholzibacteria bacterium]
MNGRDRTIVVKGTGTVSQAPDVFGIRFDVQGHEMEYADSLVSLNTRVEELRQAIETAGLSRDSLKTTSFDISRDTVYNRKTEKHDFNGYIATHNLKIEFPRNMDKSNKLLGAIVEKVSSADFSIYFTVSDPKALKDRLVQEAVQNARKKAGLMVDAAGVKLGKILNINYSWSEVHFHREMVSELRCSAMVDFAAQPDFEPEDIEKSDNVEVVWEII